MAFESTLKKSRAKRFPIKLSSEFLAELATNEEFDFFIKKNFSKVFKPRKDRHYIRPAPTKKAQELRANYVENSHRELILIKSRSGETVGWFMGEAFDSTTFYMRNSGILPKFQGRGLYSSFLNEFIGYLKELGYQRINSQHHSDNPAILIPKLKAGFMITGMEAREEWGLLVLMTKLLTASREKGWKQKFL